MRLQLCSVCGEMFDIDSSFAGRRSEKEAHAGGEVDAGVEEKSTLVGGGFAPRGFCLKRVSLVSVPTQRFEAVRISRAYPIVGS